ncbi:MAG TPA: carboxylesterase [Burkholderiales bacterium]|nr:carboxylesterase [Burkholderiales bacterium]
MAQIEFETSERPAFSVIWLHGLGADGNDFVPVAEALSLPDTRFIFPHAPMMPVTLNGGYVMRAWYDIYSLDPSLGEDREGILASCEKIQGLVELEADRGVKPDHVFLAGFSQGGAIALSAGLRHSRKLAGIIALSTYLPLRESLEPHPANSETPVFMAHGVGDGIIPVSAGISSREKLIALGHDVAWHAYAMEHAVCQQEILDISTWMKRIIHRKDGSATA